METLIPELRSLYSAIRTRRVANIDRPLNTLIPSELSRFLKKVTREQLIGGEPPDKQAPRSPAHNESLPLQLRLCLD